MSIRIITGSTGTNHVTSQDDGSLNQVILGSKSVVLDIGEKLAAVVVDNNTVRISDGDLLLQGRHARIDAGTVEDMTIGTGTIEMNRNDLIVARYTLDTGTGFENIELVVLEGTETSGSASDPAYNTGDIRTGSAIVDFPLYRVRIEGINIVGLVRLFDISGGANSSLIGNAYSATKSYKSGEYCIDNGIMWRSRIDNNIGNTPAENSYWTRASIANDVSTLNQNLTFDGNYVFRVGLDGDGNPGFYKADDSFSPFSSAEVVESFYNTESFSTVKYLATYPSYTTLGNVEVTNPKAKKAIVGFMSQTLNSRTGYWRLSVNDIEVDSYSVKGTSSSATWEYHTFVIDVKPNDVIKMESATSNGGSQSSGLGYIIHVLA